MHYGYLYAAILATMACLVAAILLVIGAAVIDNYKDLLGEAVAGIIFAALVTFDVWCWAHVG